MTGKRTVLSAANGGWVYVTIDDEPPFLVRVLPSERGRLEVVELQLAPGGPIDSSMLRQLQLTRVEAQVNAPDLREYIIDRLDLPATMVFDRTDRTVEGGDLVVPAGAAGGSGKAFDASVAAGTKHASGEAHVQQRVGGTATGRKIDVEITDSVGVRDEVKVVVSPTRRPRARLRIPATNPKPPSFYKQVAVVYTRLAGQSHRPVVELAEANEVPWSTAQRWVKEARRRGFLPPGQKGRRG
jgi:hypothetical protein